ncbi:MAG: sigma-70 family RNA polymerase sigma factor [Candidatus Eisenbacteria bacterium]|uniref:Sigma-70 family RNA polymerase sigma factor n=1 Tax=Eiseniibacteriota bacterium TaxID=2212470 RepID=A0A849SKM1_UNCEI|nr:sigma-70 family RNA polymerase sigma factor [Candidatus Eisenbacteria bacterium]
MEPNEAKGGPRAWDAAGGASHPLESTAVLLERTRGGDREAHERLFARFIPILTRWAHQRLPRGARDLSDTPDIVQVTLMRAFARLDAFEPRGEGAFLGYLRQILMNAVRDEIRRVARRRPAVQFEHEIPDPRPSALEELLGREALDRYERALARLSAEQREAVILRIELGYDHARIAEALGKPTANAARMLVARSLAVLAEEMRD